jgi:hypothetical protein
VVENDPEVIQSNHGEAGGGSSSRGVQVGKAWTNRLSSARVLAIPLAFYGVSRVVAMIAIYASERIAPGKPMEGALLSWDSYWFYKAIVYGYPHVAVSGHGPEAQNTIAFFPLYRMLARGVSDVTGWSVLTSGLAVSLTFGAIAAVLLWVLAEQLVGRKAADRTVALFCFFPASFLLTMLFSESVMLAFSIACLLALRQRRWVLAGLCGALATAARPNALVIVGCCAWAAGRAIWKDREWRSLAAPLLAPGGVLAYFTFLWHHTGDFFAWQHVEYAGWGYSDVDRLTAFKSLKFLVWKPLTDMNQLTTAIAFVVAIAGLVLLVFWKPPAELTIFAVGICLLAFGFGGPASKLRYVMTAFPLAIAAGRWARTDLRFSLLLACSAVGLGLYAPIVTRTVLAIP